MGECCDRGGLLGFRHTGAADVTKGRPTVGICVQNYNKAAASWMKLATGTCASVCHRRVGSASSGVAVRKRQTPEGSERSQEAI